MFSRIGRSGVALLAAGVLTAVALPALGAVSHPTVVSEDAADQTPDLVPTAQVDRPRIEAIAQLGGTNGTLYAGGLFESATESSGTSFNGLRNLMAFDPSSGAIETGFHATFDDSVLALAAGNGAIYAGGSFRTVNGQTRAALVKLDPVTGARDTAFRPPFTGGRVNDLELRNGVLYVGGSSGQKLMALDPDTGQNTGQIALGITDAIPNAWGTVSIYRMSINPQGDKLVATGNFRTVAGQSRTRLFVANIAAGTGNVTLDNWYYQGFAKACSSTHPRRIAYLQGVDFSPGGDYFVVTATGQIPRLRSEVWHPGVNNPAGTTVCDGAGRFDIANGDPTHQPTWINYTGGDSVWEVTATGAAAYVQGHFEWWDNPDGFATRCPDNQTCAPRFGIAALDSETGRALPWDPRKPSSIGGKAFLATSVGLWVGSDSQFFNGERHRGIAFLPL